MYDAQTAYLNGHITDEALEASVGQIDNTRSSGTFVSRSAGDIGQSDPSNSNQSETDTQWNKVGWFDGTD